MGVIRKKLLVFGGLEDKNGKDIMKELDVLFDSGASVSFIKSAVAKDLCSIVKTTPDIVRGAKKLRIKVNKKCSFETEIEGEKIEDIAYLIDDIADGIELILGAHTFQRYGMVLEFNDDEKIGDTVRVTKPLKNLLLL